MDPQRRSTAAAILSNIHYNAGNATTLYKAEVKLKFAALLQLRGEKAWGEELLALPACTGSSALAAAAPPLVPRTQCV